MHLIFLLKDFDRGIAVGRTESSGEEGRGSSGKGAVGNRTKGKQRRRRHIVHLDGLKRREVGRLELYRTLARNLARCAEGASLILSDLDLRATVSGHREGLLGTSRRTLTVVMMKVLHHEQMKLDDYRRPDH